MLVTLLIMHDRCFPGIRSRSAESAKICLFKVNRTCSYASTPGCPDRVLHSNWAAGIVLWVATDAHGKICIPVYHCQLFAVGHTSGRIIHATPRNHT